MQHYEQLELEIIEFAEDVVRTSGEFAKDGTVRDDSWAFGQN